MDQHQKLENLIDEELERVKKETTKTKLTQSSKSIINEMIQKQVHGIFKKLDHENKGTVDLNETKSNFGSDIDKLFEPFLNSIRSKQKSLDYATFEYSFKKFIRVLAKVLTEEP